MGLNGMEALGHSRAVWFLRASASSSHQSEPQHSQSGGLLLQGQGPAPEAPREYLRVGRLLAADTKPEAPMRAVQGLG